MRRLLRCFGILSLIAFCAPIVHAQQTYLGFRLGTNLANEWIDQNSEPSGASNDINVGILGGAQFDYQFNPIWSLSMELLFDQKGTDIRLERFNYWKPTYNYIEVPILLKTSFGSGNFSPYVFTGPSFGIYLSGSYQEDVIPATVYDFDGSIPTTKVRSPDIAAEFGAGLQLKLSSSHILFIDASYALGLVNILKSNPFFAPNFSSVFKSRDIRLAAGILFPM